MQLEVKSFKMKLEQPQHKKLKCNEEIEIMKRFAIVRHEKCKSMAPKLPHSLTSFVRMSMIKTRHTKKSI